MVNVVQLVEDGPGPPSCGVALDLLDVPERGGAAHAVAGAVVDAGHEVLLAPDDLHLAHDAAGGVALEAHLAAGPGRAHQLAAGVVGEGLDGLVGQGARDQLAGAIVSVLGDLAGDLGPHDAADMVAPVGEPPAVEGLLTPRRGRRRRAGAGAPPPAR